MSYSANDLTGAQLCFISASRLLYCEPSIEVVANQVVTRQFEAAPFGERNLSERGGLSLMDSWCVEAFRATGAPFESQQEDAAERLAELPLFQESVKALQREWLRLFVGLGTPEASCLESYYVEPNSHMLGKSTLAVREAYRRHGLQIEKLHSEPDDHLGLMLGFVAHLIAEELDAIEMGDEVAAEGFAKEQDEFLTNHILPWLAVWRYAVEKHAVSDYYRGVGDFVFGLCACYAERFMINFNERDQVFKRRC